MSAGTAVPTKAPAMTRFPVKLNIPVYTKREKELVETIGKAYAESDGSLIPVFVPLERDLTKWLLGRWIPLPLIGRLVGVVRKIFRWLAPLGFLAQHFDKIEGWLRTIEVFRICDSGATEETPAEEMAKRERLLRNRSDCLQRDLESLLSDISEELRRRRLDAADTHDDPINGLTVSPQPYTACSRSRAP